MKISIITPTFNSEKTVSDTIESVFSQTHKDIEYIVIDGVSSDKTLEIISSYQQKFNIRLLSEKDSGLYDAMNKGIELASGEVIAILNSDDLYYDNQVLSVVASAFSDLETDIVYGDIIYFSDQVDKVTRVWRAREYQQKQLKNGWTIPHPAMFVRRRVYEQFDKYRLDLKLAADYEFILRVLLSGKVKLKYLPKILTKMYAGGASGKNIKQRIRGWRELRQAWRINKLQPPKLFICRRVGSKLKQLIVSKRAK